MSNILVLNNAVKKNIKEMVQGEVFYVELNKDDLWDTYLSSFPEGSNPIFRERSHYDCSCCKQFVTGIGNMVSIGEDGHLKTVWDVDVEGTIFQPVANALAEFVERHSIAGVYRHHQRSVGVESNLEELPSGDVIKWDHLYARLPNDLVLASGESLGSVNSEIVSDYDVLKRTLETITEEAVEIVLDLIDQDSLYRGEEHRYTVATLDKVMDEYKQVNNKSLFLWKKSRELKRASRFINTVIGTLLEDISKGVELEDAVKSFESKVAPTNYKRPKSLITQKMIDNAQKKVQELDLTHSLNRRYARAEDISVNNVLFADRSSRKVMKDVFDDLKPTAGSSKSYDKVEEISIEDFITKVLPKAETIEVLMENSHVNNLFSLVAPEYDAAESLFKWDNGFSWSYNGEVTDSIKERVKKAGGDITGDVRVSLSWSNHDDLDLHIEEPRGSIIYYGNRTSQLTSGMLDIDMNAGGPFSREAVENIFWRSKHTMVEGRYEVHVHNYYKREWEDEGFEVELDILGNSRIYSYNQSVGNRARVNVVEFEVNNTGDIKIVKEYLPVSQKTQEVWGLSTGNFHKVSMVMLSPNHWDGLEIGNKHYMFVLDECKNPDSVRGFYNEFLRNDLTEHRKVFEVLASKMKGVYSDNQLSGLGFSSTARNEFICKVSGSFNRTLKVKV